jgi:hypothetical protein
VDAAPAAASKAGIRAAVGKTSVTKARAAGERAAVKAAEAAVKAAKTTTMEATEAAVEAAKAAATKTAKAATMEAAKAAAECDGALGSDCDARGDRCAHQKCGQLLPVRELPGHRCPPGATSQP